MHKLFSILFLMPSFLLSMDFSNDIDNFTREETLKELKEYELLLNKYDQTLIFKDNLKLLKGNVLAVTGCGLLAFTMKSLGYDSVLAHVGMNVSTIAALTRFFLMQPIEDVYIQFSSEDLNELKRGALMYCQNLQEHLDELNRQGIYGGRLRRLRCEAPLLNERALAKK